MVTTRSASRPQYPPRILKLLASWDKSQTLVSDLKSKLRLAQQECRRLEKEFDRYQASIPSIAPIRTCPPEILSIIFQFYLLKNPRLIRRLLLVCRKWYKLVVNDPRMWNRIFVTIGDDWDVKCTAKSIKRRINVCLRRSATLLLDLNLDFGGLRSSGDRILERISDCLVEDVENEDWDDFRESLYGLNLDEDKLPPISICLAEHALQVARILVGKNNRLMKRWGGLQIILPDDILMIVPVWELLCRGHTPNLTSLSIEFGEATCVEKLVDGFPDLSALKHFATNIQDLDFLPLNHSTLESLVICTGVHGWESLHLSRFTHLQYLEFNWMWNDRHGSVEDFEVTLPHLQQLSFTGNVHWLDRVKFHVPVLQYLRFIDRTVILRDIHLCVFPNLVALRVHWSKKTICEVQKDWPDAALESEMRMLLDHFKDAKHFTFSHFAKETCMEVAQAQHELGLLSNALETFTFETPGGDREIVDVRMLF